jgi:hypothetical protein
VDWILHRCQVFLYGMLVVFGKNQKIYGMLVTCEWNGKWIKYSMYFKRINFIIHIKFYKFGEVGITTFYFTHTIVKMQRNDHFFHVFISLTPSWKCNAIIIFSLENFIFNIINLKIFKYTQLNLNIERMYIYIFLLKENQWMGNNVQLPISMGG